MREINESTAVEFYVTDASSGEQVSVTGRKEVTAKYFSIRELTSRVNAMNLLNTLAKICRSSKDLEAVNMLLDSSDSSGRVLIGNITKTAESLEVSRSKFNVILKGCVDENLFKKESTGVYFVNPFIFIGRRVRSNQEREKLQQEWKTLGE